MKLGKFLLILIVLLSFSSTGYGAAKNAPFKKRIFLVSSYHREYNWSIETNKGFCNALLKFGHFDNGDQISAYTINDYVETSRSVIKKMWMDSKRKKTNEEKATAATAITKAIKEFKPVIIFLGDDEAAEYVGSQFLDADIPIVFWGLNQNPVKYGLVDRAEKPGHNVTGVYQSGYHMESVKLLRTIAPRIKTFAVLTDDTPSGRSNMKAVEYLARKGEIPLKLVETVATNNAELWKKRALELQEKVDAFYVAQYSGLIDKNGNSVPDLKTAAWYITHIKIPEFAGFKFRVEEGMLCAADDSGYNQAYEAVVIGHDILAKRAKPAVYPIRAPKRGLFVANKQRAEILGIKFTKDMGIEEIIEKASALEK